MHQPTAPPQRQQLIVDTLRFLAVDAVERAGSGHPGLPLGAAPMVQTLWDRFLEHNPSNPAWPDRDRFVLSAGHGSALLYALLHVHGYDLPLTELERFRQSGSRTPGHPEVGETPGVEATTGPLGQGAAMAVGMAMTERFLAECFNTPDYPVIDHRTYALVSDGDLMEGISCEAASLAGTLGLGKLAYLYDDNHVSIEGDTGIAFTENVCERFDAYGWQVLRVADGNDREALGEALEDAEDEDERPSLLVVRTRIGYGSPKEGTAEAHGKPLGEEVLRETKERLGWSPDRMFHVPDEAREYTREVVQQGRRREERWRERVAAYGDRHPALARRLRRQLEGELPEGWEAELPSYSPDQGPLATRNASGDTLNALTDCLPELIGGSADLAPSTKTLLAGYGDFGFDEACRRNIHFGVREHAMGGIVNGMALHGGVLPYGATFLVFSDYMRPSLRLAALMGTGTVFVFTHDSIGLGEDGPTHQPVEHLISLRAIPGFRVYRPADARETVGAWRSALEADGPAALALSRQALPVLEVDTERVRSGVRRGAYTVADAEGRPDVILIATGSEVHVALEARRRLGEEDLDAKVVSMPCWELFEAQPRDYREEVLPPGVGARVAVEAGAPEGWRRWVGEGGEIVAVRGFGESAPGEEVLRDRGFTGEDVASRARVVVDREASEASTAPP